MHAYIHTHVHKHIRACVSNFRYIAQVFTIIPTNCARKVLHIVTALPPWDLCAQSQSGLFAHVCMYGCMYVCVYVCVCVYVRMFVSYSHGPATLGPLRPKPIRSLCACMYVCVYVCIYIYIYACMYVCMCVCVYVCTYVCII